MRGRFGQRQDLFLPLSAPIVQQAVGELVTNLRPLLEAACGPEAALHELSCIYAAPGAPRQCVHADTIVLPCPQYPDAHMEPLYTFFVALQDVEDNMGHTQVGIDGIPCGCRRLVVAGLLCDRHVHHSWQDVGTAWGTCRCFCWAGDRDCLDLPCCCWRLVMPGLAAV